MSADFLTLSAPVVAGIPEVSACLLLSGKGLTLACSPPSEERRVTERWAHLPALGDVERGFVVIEGETWALVRRRRFVGLAVAAADSRVGAILVELERERAARRARKAGAAGEPGSPDAVEADPLDVVGEFGGLLSLSVGDEETA